MPSGAKRRKALKRKKEKEQNLQQSQQQVGEGNEGPDFKTHDEEKGSDSGDSSTPTAEASEENFSKTHEELMGGSQSGSGDKVVVVVVEDLKINADGSERRGVDIEFVGSVKSSSSDNSNSSDEEESYQMDEKKTNGSRVLEEEGEDKKVEESPNFEPIEKVLEKQDEKDEVAQVLGHQPESSSGAPIVIDLVMKLKEEGSNEEKSSHVDDNSVEAGNGGNHVGEFELDKSAKDSDGRISLDNQQQQVVTAPPTVQPTSWRSCCGLFDILMGSNR